MQNIDLDKPVEIDEDIYWVGSSEEALLRRNIYLRVYRVNSKANRPKPPAFILPRDKDVFLVL